MSSQRRVEDIDDEVDDLQAMPSLSIPSLHSPTTEEERRRIIDSILGEDGDDSDDEELANTLLLGKQSDNSEEFDALQSSSPAEEQGTDLKQPYQLPVAARKPHAMDAFSSSSDEDEEEDETFPVTKTETQHLSVSEPRKEPESLTDPDGRSPNSFTFDSIEDADNIESPAVEVEPAVAAFFEEAVSNVVDEMLTSEAISVNPESSTRGGGTDERVNSPTTQQASFSVPSNVTQTMDGTSLVSLQNYYKNEEERENMRRSFQQSISAAVLVSLAYKRYERRRLAAMEIEKVVRSLVVQEDYERVRAILLLLSDDYVRSTNEDARKGGAVALAACAIGLKKANESRRDVLECRDLILASVIHACQDHSQRVRYYATESLFNVTKVIPSLAVQHFFILFEILRSLYADVDLDVRSGSELLDKKLKEVIVGAINSGSFSADACIPVFARFVHLRNKATKQLTLTWLKEFSDKLIGAPTLEFLHMFLGGIFSMVADPNTTIRQLALDFLQSVLPKLLVNNEDFEDAQQKVDFDKILSELVLTMEHPDPFVRKVAMYWMSRIVQCHMAPDDSEPGPTDTGVETIKGERQLTAASISVRNALPHVLPGILVSVGDTHQSRSKDSFLPDQTTHSLAEQANNCLQEAVRRDGSSFIPHLGGFIVALREELDSPGGLNGALPPSVERRPYRMDVKADGSGIESTGWFRASDGVEEKADNALILSRLCALQWVVVLYENVVPSSLKPEFSSEFVDCILYQLVDLPPGIIVVKSFEVLGKITQVEMADVTLEPIAQLPEQCAISPMDEDSVKFALGILDVSQRKRLSRDRSVFASLIDLHSKHSKLMGDVSKVIELMCTLQAPEFVFMSFAIELDNFILSRMKRREKVLESPDADTQAVKRELASFAKALAFVSNFAQQLGVVFFAAPETEQLRINLKDCIGRKGKSLRDDQRATLFHILLHTFAQNIVAALSFCLWSGAFLTASTFIQRIDPLDVSLMLYLEVDQMISLLERPIFRHLHLRLLECEDDPYHEGSGAMLFRTLKSILMLLPQSTSYMILKERLLSTARYRQSAVALNGLSKRLDSGSSTDVFVKRIADVRQLHCDAKWRAIRAESLEDPAREVGEDQKLTCAQKRREWLGYADEEEELATKARIKQHLLGDPKVPERGGPADEEAKTSSELGTENEENAGEWKEFWARSR